MERTQNKLSVPVLTYLLYSKQLAVAALHGQGHSGFDCEILHIFFKQTQCSA